MGLFKDYGWEAKKELKRLKKRLFGDYVECMNLSSNASSDAILSMFLGRINNLESEVNKLKVIIAELKPKVKTTKKRGRPKKS